MMFGVQSWINMAVNLRAIPAKGMTLPFISYGGSSLLALGLGMGFLIALTRRRPLRRSPAKTARAGLSGSRCILLAAGGTGGHLFPASALASALARRGVDVELATDERALKYGGEFPARAIHSIPSATTTGAGGFSKARATLVLGAGLVAALALVARLRPRAVVGFGGYPTVPPLLAASLLGAPTVLHEQNAVMGRANRFLAARVSLIAAGFPDAERAAARCARQNTISPAIPCVPASSPPRRRRIPTADGRLRLLVTGGSQGAKVMADVIPARDAAVARGARPHPPHHAGARRGQEPGRRRLRADGLSGRTRRILYRSSGANRGCASRRRPRRRLDRLGTRRDRPAVDPGAVSRTRSTRIRPQTPPCWRLGGAAQVVPQSEFTPERLVGPAAPALADPASLTAADGGESRGRRRRRLNAWPHFWCSGSRARRNSLQRRRRPLPRLHGAGASSGSASSPASWPSAQRDHHRRPRNMRRRSRGPRRSFRCASLIQPITNGPE